MLTLTLICFIYTKNINKTFKITNKKYFFKNKMSKITFF